MQGQFLYFTVTCGIVIRTVVELLIQWIGAKMARTKQIKN